jgi:hypothetical protein
VDAAARTRHGAGSGRPKPTTWITLNGPGSGGESRLGSKRARRWPWLRPGPPLCSPDGETVWRDGGARRGCPPILSLRAVNGPWRGGRRPPVADPLPAPSGPHDTGARVIEPDAGTTVPTAPDPDRPRAGVRGHRSRPPSPRSATGVALSSCSSGHEPTTRRLGHERVSGLHIVRPRRFTTADDPVPPRVAPTASQPLDRLAGSG